jgi:cupin superfamily acireductone dioxygenase involved in methionine salvage
MKTKPIILVIVTLIIGFVLGMLTSAQIRYHKLKPVKVFFSEERFRDGIYRAIQPDEKQKAKIDLVLDKYARINSERQNNFRKELDSSMKDFRKEIDTYLTKDQLSRLKEMDDRRQEMVRQYRNKHPHQEHDTTNLPGNK